MQGRCRSGEVTARRGVHARRRLRARCASFAASCACAALGVVAPALAQGPASLAAAADSPRWDLQGNAKPSRMLDRACLALDGGAAAPRGFFGIQFRVRDDGANGEWVYLRQHKSGLPDAMQYTPVLNTGLNWQLYSGPGFTGAVEIPRDVWFHLRLEIEGAQAKLFVADMDTPALLMPDLKSGIQKGELALASLSGLACFADFRVRTTPDAAWQRHFPPMPPGTLVRWGLSPSYDALARNLERAPTAAEIASIRWQEVEAEPPGLVVINRYRESPHPRVSFANDPAKRLEPQPGMRVVYARTTIESDRDRTQKLSLGYSDDVSVFLNGTILYRGRSAQYFRDPGFLGIVDAENDAVYLPLKKGSNELVLAVSELGGGWGFIARLADIEP